MGQIHCSASVETALPWYNIERRKKVIHLERDMNGWMLVVQLLKKH